MPKKQSGFDLVRQLVMKLPDVTESTIHGAPAWKVGRKLLACEAIHKSAEPNSLMVKVDPEERTALLSAQPDIYYQTEHYAHLAVVLVRLAHINRRELQALLNESWHFVSGE